MRTILATFCMFWDQATLLVLGLYLAGCILACPQPSLPPSEGWE